MEFDVLSGTVATNEEVLVPEILNTGQFIEVVEEMALYQQLSKQLSELEVMVDYTDSQVKTIQVLVEKMMIRLDEKEELLMRCEWLITMKDIEGCLDQLTTLEAVKVTRAQLGRVQTCPLKNELQQKLEALEAQLTPVEKQLSPKEALVEAIFMTGNETFMNLGSAGRNHIVEEVVKGDGKVETAIAKAEALEASVQATKQSSSIAVLRQALQQLPLQNFKTIPVEHEAEVLQKLLDNANWNGLFLLDLQIKHTTAQIYRKYNPIQEGVLTTLILDEKVKEKLGVQQL
ncbi:hypothetical protein JTI58_12180 [Lysinibacillus fusiformis]|uniref:hypothetical protein n=1 Tax=Lysinibacillus fusiformis TaxID=28031 RepID=UPI00196869F8|nr:hypothetical protein [Lysinibacillus fusiformis]QSB12315.1 hypothetical protein JTI58_12180 [Lysinibacillus fusiformis]